MTKTKINITYIGDSHDTVFISSANYNFTYTKADDIVKPELKGRYRYFGGLQSHYKQGSKEYNELEKQLANLAEAIINQLNE